MRKSMETMTNSPYNFDILPTICDDKTSLNEHHLTLNWVPILDKIGSPWQVGAVSYPSYKYYFRKFFSMQLITGSDFNNAGISCKENLDL